MIGRLIMGLLWLAYVSSEGLISAPMPSMLMEKMSMTPEPKDSLMTNLMSIKTKRYLSHQHSSPCPPFYPHFGMHMPMHDTRPYGPPAYPKNDIHMHQQPQHQLQYVHQPTYTSYVPKQMIQEIRAPIYQHPIVSSPPIQHPPPMHPIVKQPLPPSTYYNHQQPSMYQHRIFYEKQPIFSYAPAYYKPMPMIWPAMPIKKHEYQPPKVSYNQPTIVYKSEPPKCAPCPPVHQPQQPSVSHVKIAQPEPTHARIFLPAPLHQPIVKPCAK